MLNFRVPTPVQAKVIPAAISGRDIHCAAPTGTGKTAAFALPMLQRLSHHGNAVPVQAPAPDQVQVPVPIPVPVSIPVDGGGVQRTQQSPLVAVPFSFNPRPGITPRPADHAASGAHPRAVRAPRRQGWRGRWQRSPGGLILSPTRELAAQIQNDIKSYSRFMGLRSVVIHGQTDQREQERDLARRTDIIVATPGRLMDLMDQGIVNLRETRMVVLDEADCLLDMGFVDDILFIVSHARSREQTMFFSATMPSALEQVTSQILNDPLYVEIKEIWGKITEQLYIVGWNRKSTHLASLINRFRMRRVLVFCRTRNKVDEVVDFLTGRGMACAPLHGNKSQATRTKNLADFRSGNVSILVCTDVGARGVHIEGVSHVINYDLPGEHELYVHRIGRTGRAGRHGWAITFCDPGQIWKLRQLENFLGRSLEPPPSWDRTGPTSSRPASPRPVPLPGANVPSGTSTGIPRNSRPSSPVAGSARQQMLAAVQKMSDQQLIRLLTELPGLLQNRRDAVIHEPRIGIVDSVRLD